MNDKQVRIHVVFITVVQVHRNVLKLNDNFCGLFFHSFSGSDVEWNTSPSEVVDQELAGNKGFCIGVRSDIIFICISRNRYTVNFTSMILSAHKVFIHFVFAIGRSALSTFTFSLRISSVFNLIGGSIARRATICIIWFCTMSRRAPDFRNILRGLQRLVIR